MKLTVKDLFDIPILKNFKVVAGAGGLSRPVTQTDILDFEFVKGAHMARQDILDKDSIVLTSLLFAKDEPSLICDAVEKMYDLEVSCMAYKKAIVSELPKDALDFANKHNFPILEFGGDEFFEDIRYEINLVLRDGEDIESLEKDFNKILDQEMTYREEFRVSKKINTDFKKYMKVVAIKDADRSRDDQILSLVKKMQEAEKISKKASLCKFKDGYFIFLSQDNDDARRFDALLTDILIAIDIDKTRVNCGESSIKATAENFGKILREAYWACSIAAMENIPMKAYDDLGIYRLLIPEIHSQNVRNYMKEYLAPLDREKPELLETACTYVLSKGDLDLTAHKLFCHTNTIRYRLSKLHTLLDPSSNDKEFFENLSIAVRIFMLSQFL